MAFGLGSSDARGEWWFGLHLLYGKRAIKIILVKAPILIQFFSSYPQFILIHFIF
jgi:hypothetical protein